MMTGPDSAPQTRRALARLYDWVLFTAVAVHLQFGTEYMALWYARAIEQWLAIEPEPPLQVLRTFVVPNHFLLESSEPFTQFWAKMLFVTPMVLVFLYEMPLVALCGQTVGKMMTGIRIVRFDNGQLPGWGRSARRWLVLYGPMLIPSIGWLITLLVYFVSSKLDPHGRALHDRIAGTIVIAQPPPDAAG